MVELNRFFSVTLTSILASHQLESYGKSSRIFSFLFFPPHPKQGSYGGNPLSGNGAQTLERKLAFLFFSFEGVIRNLATGPLA